MALGGGGETIIGGNTCSVIFISCSGGQNKLSVLSIFSDASNNAFSVFFIICSGASTPDKVIAHVAINNIITSHI